MKRFLALLLLCATIFTLSSCGKYSSSYSAVGLVKRSDRDSCSVSFMSLSGTISFNIRLDGHEEGELEYEGKLEEGSLSVYYDIYGTKELLFSLKAGEKTEGSGGYIESGKCIHVIIEANGAKGGSVKVEAD